MGEPSAGDMYLDDLHLDDLRALAAVVEAGGFGRAAERLSVSKSIVSRRIARLEAGLGARLLNRTTRGIGPTEVGATFAQTCRRVLADLDAARAAAAGGDGDLVGALRVAAPLSLGVQHLAPVIAEFAGEHPRLVIETAYDDAYADLVRGGFDAAVRVGALPDSSLVARRLCAIETVLVASPAYLAARGRPRTPAELAGHECLVYQGGSPGAPWRFRVGRRWVGVRPAGRIRADSGEALRTAALAGLGIAALPTFIVEGQLAARSLVRVLPDCAMPERALTVVRPPGQPSAPLRAFIDRLAERFGGRG